MDKKIFTYQTRIKLNTIRQEDFLRDTALLLNVIERKLFADYSRGLNMAEQKSRYLQGHGISARQFNAVRINLEGKIKSCLELQSEYIADTLYKIEQEEKELIKLQKIKVQTKKIAQKIANKTRTLTNLRQKLAQLKEDKAKNKARICFGSKKLFKSQFNLEKNGYDSHGQWKEDWEAARSSQFYLIGSKDETTGNQSCITTINDDDTVNLSIKVPPALEAKYGQHIVLENIKLNYGKEEIFTALAENIKRNKLKKKAAQAQHGEIYKNHGRAINFRFLCDAKGWRVFITVDKMALKKISIQDLGGVGVDINHDHLAVTEINHTGNFINSTKVSLCTYGKTSEQAKALIGDAVKIIVDYAVQKNKPIIIEQLDFSKKKRALAQENKKTARMLSSFCYGAIIKMLHSRAFRSGVEVFSVNPAYSSVIGRVKFARIYKISNHEAAALVIARRHYGYSENLPRCWENIPDDVGGRMILPRLAKISGKHIWSSWAKEMKELKAALAVQFQMFRQAMVSPGLTRDVLEQDVPF